MSYGADNLIGETGLYEVIFGYGFGVRHENLGRMEEFFGDHFVVAGDGVEYPWSRDEARKKKYYPNGFTDPIYDDEGNWE